jgi:glycosyltransferase involved in cell wall biosynthesis
MKNLNIDVLCSDGSPLGVTYKTIYGDNEQVGVGGAELALLTMCEVWSRNGHHVRLYNNPREVGVSPFEQLAISEYNPADNRDIVITFRSPNARSVVSNGMKVFWSCDQYTNGDYSSFAKSQDKIICISPRHSQFFADKYKIENTSVIDLPVRTWDYDDLCIEKVPNRLVFTSIPDRGLEGLYTIWDELLKNNTDVSLVITSDYRLWGAHNGAMNERHRVRWITKDKIRFLGAIPRSKLIMEELEADLLVYPCTYDELFCISVAEAQYAGAYPITSSVGALVTTNMGHIVHGNGRDLIFLQKFCSELNLLLQDRTELKKLQKEVKQKALDRFHPDVIANKWNSIFEGAL